MAENNEKLSARPLAELLSKDDTKLTLFIGENGEDSKLIFQLEVPSLNGNAPNTESSEISLLDYNNKTGWDPERGMIEPPESVPLSENLDVVREKILGSLKKLNGIEVKIKAENISFELNKSGGTASQNEILDDDDSDDEIPGYESAATRERIGPGKDRPTGADIEDGKEPDLGIQGRDRSWGKDKTDDAEEGPEELKINQEEDLKTSVPVKDSGEAPFDAYGYKPVTVEGRDNNSSSLQINQGTTYEQPSHISSKPTEENRGTSSDTEESTKTSERKSENDYLSPIELKCSMDLDTLKAKGLTEEQAKLFINALNAFGQDTFRIGVAFNNKGDISGFSFQFNDDNRPEAEKLKFQIPASLLVQGMDNVKMQEEKDNKKGLIVESGNSQPVVLNSDLTDDEINRQLRSWTINGESLGRNTEVWIVRRDVDNPKGIPAIFYE